MKGMSIKIARLAVLLACSAVVLAGCGKKSDQPSASKGQVVARVGEEVVTVQDLETEFRWANVLRPLLEFCRQPRRAPDVAAEPKDLAPELGVRVQGRHRRRRTSRLRSEFELARNYQAMGGGRLVVKRVLRRLSKYIIGERLARRAFG